MYFILMGRSTYDACELTLWYMASLYTAIRKYAL